MTDYCVGCDNINGKEKSYISKIAKVLREKGNNVEELSVGPNFVQSKGLSSSSKGKTAVFIVGGSDIGTYVDFKQGLESGYYHYKYIWFAFASWTASTWITCKELKNRALVRAHDDNFSSSSSLSAYIGKSADYFFSKNKAKMNYVCGQSPEELAQKILGGGDSKNEDSKSGSGSNVKDCIQKLLKHWDGDVECYIRGDEIHINKVRNPDEYYSCSLTEEVNVLTDSVTLTDINPGTVNHLTVTWTGGKIEFKDEKLISRFGENPLEIPAVRKVTKTVIEEKTDTDTDTDSEDEDTESEE